MKIHNRVLQMLYLLFLNYIYINHSNAFIIDVFILDSKGNLEQELKKVARNFYKKQRKKTILGKFLKYYNLIYLLYS